MKVTAKVLAHVRGEKLRVFKFKPKRGYKRRTGHRQELTQIEVTEITHGKAKAKAAAKPAEGAGEGRESAESSAESGGQSRAESGQSRDSESEGEARRWLIRRGSARAATAATQTRSASA